MAITPGVPEHPPERVPPTGGRPPLRLTARSPEDLLALAPVLLGFWPEQSVVMLTFGARRPFHARLDLPGRRADAAEVAELFLEPARRHGVRGVVFLFYSEDVADAEPTWAALRRGARRSGVAVLQALWADARRYRRLDRAQGEATAHGEAPVEYDVSSHPFVVQAMVEGRLPFRTRAEMVASLRSDPTAVAAVEAALAGAGAPGAEPAPGQVAAWVRRQVGRAPSAATIAEVMPALGSPPSAPAEVALGQASGDADEERWLWAGVLPQVPESHVPAVATLLGFAAWRAGDGAMAWAAVDRARGVAPDDAGAARLAALLEMAVPPGRRGERSVV
ncbi:DUF4192 domain-containing protein [Nocardioides sp. YIM 152588]|uniref:DUF4192 domain-containing protein n=1 Tax=Nocardioides sp. YIM 152588 TaxID=3158259 RepID=UPI0032E4D281